MAIEGTIHPNPASAKGSESLKEISTEDFAPMLMRNSMKLSANAHVTAPAYGALDVSFSLKNTVITISTITTG